MWWEAGWLRGEEVVGKKEGADHNYVGGGMHGWAVAASQRCIRAYAGRGEVDLK